MFSEVYDCIVEFQHTYMKFEKKSSTASMQYFPKLFINQVTVPTMDIGKSFKYLGRFSNFSMGNFDHFSEVLQLVTDFMKKTG